jgi:hypothetical protein
MLKRDLAILEGQPDVDSPRAKRRKDTAPGPAAAAAANGAGATSEALEDAGARKVVPAVSESPAQVREQGTLLWEIAKAAVNKE